MAINDPVLALQSEIGSIENAFSGISPQQALSLATSIASAANSLLGGSKGDTSHLWPVQGIGTPTRLPLAGPPSFEGVFHKMMKQGDYLETEMGSAMTHIQAKKKDLQEKIADKLDDIRLSITCKLQHTPRVVKLVSDIAHFLKQVQTYQQDVAGLMTALQANIAVLEANEAQMVQMIQNNIRALANLLAEICNWHLPALPSLPQLLGGQYHFDGFNFSINFNFNPNLSFNPSFVFSACLPRNAQIGGLFSAPVNSLLIGSYTASLGSAPIPGGAAYGNPAEYSSPSYIAQMRATSSIVVDPDSAVPVTGSLLPPSAIISDYQLTPAQYQANICSIVPALQPIVVQPGDPDYGTSPSAARLLRLRSLLGANVSLGQVVASNYDPNLTACWLFYLAANRAGRGGTWIPAYAQAYAAYIAPSLAYLASVPTPYNAVLGGPGVQDAPTAVPLIAVLEADQTLNILWKLSYVEASLLGYARNTAWDSGADSAYTSGPTGADPDYEASAYQATPTTAAALGQGTAVYPVATSFPTSIADAFNQAVALAAVSIASASSYLSPSPKNRYIYDQFADAALVDKYSQFWRDFNANLQKLLASDAYSLAFAVHYPAILNAALNPLADPAPYAQLEADAASRNRSWTPGSSLLAVPTALTASLGGGGIVDGQNGYVGGTLDPAAYLARPDVMAQPLPTQVAMLRLNQGYASLMVLQNSIQTATAQAVASARSVVAQANSPSWQVETSGPTVAPPGGGGTTVAFPLTDFDYTGFVAGPTAIAVQQAGAYLVSLAFDWDPAGSPGTRSASILKNGEPVSTQSVDQTATEPYLLQLSDLLAFEQGDVLEVQVSHSLPTAQTLLPGAAFFGLLDAGATPEDTAPVSAAATVPSVSLPAGQPLAVGVAVSFGADGTTLPVDPTTTDPNAIPFVDGVTLAPAAAAGDGVAVGTSYGAIYPLPTESLAVGGLIYVSAGGVLTQDYATLITQVGWVVSIGRAVTAGSFLFEPHIPSQYISGN